MGLAGAGSWVVIADIAEAAGFRVLKSEMMVFFLCIQRFPIFSDGHLRGTVLIALFTFCFQWALPDLESQRTI
jgi:hypothetical protein